MEPCRSRSRTRSPCRWPDDDAAVTVLFSRQPQGPSAEDAAEAAREGERAAFEMLAALQPPRAPAAAARQPEALDAEASAAPLAEEELARWPPPNFPAMPAASDEAATVKWMALCDAENAGARLVRARTFESSEPEDAAAECESGPLRYLPDDDAALVALFSPQPPGPSAEDAAEYPSVEEEVESVGLEERARWRLARSALLQGWAAVTAEAACSQILWERDKAAEGAEIDKYCDADASAWTPAQQVEARREGVAVGRAGAAERARWRAFAEGVFANVAAAIMTEPA